MNSAEKDVLETENSALPVEAEKRSVMVVAGEASGDHHAAHVVSSLLKLDPELSVFGMGGGHLKQAGMEQIVDSEKAASVMGLTEVIGSLGSIVGALRQLKRELVRRKPSLVILVDFPDFNFILARSIHALGIPILYYISPQIWAWRSGRIKTIKRFVTKVIPIFPFEEPYFTDHGVDAQYVGHPFVDRRPPDISREQFLSDLGLSVEGETLALLPGSRKSEIERLLVPMIDAVRLLKRQDPSLQVLLPVAPALDYDWVASSIPDDVGITLVRGQANEVLHSATMAVVASGTATVEAAIAGVPFVVIYKVSALTFGVAKLLVRGVTHVGMPNLIAGREIVPELLQERVSGFSIARELSMIRDNPDRRESMKADLAEVYKRLSDPVKESGVSSSERTAQIALDIITKREAEFSNKNGLYND
jgi:lipid-A-disaccharide synthase